jgi:hypothetical protein
MVACWNRWTTLAVDSRMLPVIIYTRKRIFRYYTGFSFFVFIWISMLETDKVRLIRHEKIHFRQQLELLFIFHWLLYGFFYLISRLYGQRHYIAYRYNPFELEAYGNDLNPSYLQQRKAFAWCGYISEFRTVLRKDMTHKIPRRKEIGWD